MIVAFPRTFYGYAYSICVWRLNQSKKTITVKVQGIYRRRYLDMNEVLLDIFSCYRAFKASENHLSGMEKENRKSETSLSLNGF